MPLTAQAEYGRPVESIYLALTGLLANRPPSLLTVCFTVYPAEHSRVLDRYAYLRQRAFEYSFVFEQIGLPHIRAAYRAAGTAAPARPCGGPSASGSSG